MSVIVKLYPNAPGDSTGITTQFPNSTFHWDKVDEVVVDNDATYVESAAVSEIDFYHIGSLPTAAIVSKIVIQAIGRHTNVAGYLYVKLGLKIGGLEYWAAGNSALTNTYLVEPNNPSWQRTTNPATGVAWTQSDLADLQIGIQTYSYPALVATERITQMWVDVYLEATVFPFDAITRVTNLIHRYNRKQGIYMLEGNLGDVTSDLGVPEWSSTPQSATSPVIPSTEEAVTEVAKEVVEEAEKKPKVPAPIEFPTLQPPEVPSSSDKVTAPQPFVPFIQVDAPKPKKAAASPLQEWVKAGRPGSYVDWLRKYK